MTSDQQRRSTVKVILTSEVAIETARQCVSCVLEHQEAGWERCGFLINNAINRETAALTARESLLTASNEDLAAQVVKLTERREMAVTAIHKLTEEKRILSAHARDYENKCGEASDLRELATRLASAVDDFVAYKICDHDMIVSEEAMTGLRDALDAARNGNLLK